MSKKLMVTVSLVILLALVATNIVGAGYAMTTRVSVNSDGAEGNGSSEGVSISSDGRYVAFYSAATNLVVGDSNGVKDIFVHDRHTGQTFRGGVDCKGAEGDG